MTSLLTTEPVLEHNASAGIASRSRIRPLAESDLGEITELYRRVVDRRVVGRPFRGPVGLLRRIFFESPWRDDTLSSLGYEDETGRLVGCLGIMPRPMKFRGRAIAAAVGHHFIVESSRQGTRAAIELVRRFIGGPQDLSLTTGNEFSRRIWKSLGGGVSSLHSFSWTRALRPAQYALNVLKGRGLAASAAATLSPACHAVDAALNLFGQRAVPRESPAALSDDLDAVTMFACLSAFSSDRVLQPVYSVSSLAWLMETLGETRHPGSLHNVAVRTYSGRPLGWYVYDLTHTGVAEVLQLGGKETMMRDVLHHLFYHARQRGAIAVTGPMEAHLFGVLSESHSVFHRPENAWTLIHSRDQRIADAIHSGDAFMSRLEGAWWMRHEA